MIVDRSEVARSIISHILHKEMNGVYIVTCGSAEEAMEYLHRDKFHLITTSLLLPGLDGLDFCHEIRKSDKQHLTPVIFVSSDADRRLLKEGFSAGVTDYFNKSLGYKRLVEFMKDVLRRHAGLVGKILYVEDSLTDAEVTQIYMEKHGLHITHVTSGEKALALLTRLQQKGKGIETFDIIFTDFFLSGQMTGGDLLYAIRTQLHYSRQEMPVLVITIQDNIEFQAEIFQAGANDFTTKPVIEEVLIARLKSLLLVKHQYNVIKNYSKDIYKLETTDSLTGTYNQKFLLEEGRTLISNCPDACLIIIDIDNFQMIDEMYGHLIADHVLYLVGQFLINFVSKETIVARFVGKKFVILTPNCNLEAGKIIAANIHSEIAILKPEELEITVSLGLSASEDAEKITLANLVNNAENALSTAQEQGNNKTFVYNTDKNIVAI
ncbi:MAG: response regulator [Thiomargarita sp.]|nr:response regulator [Thiomargarita sp.]